MAQVVLLMTKPVGRDGEMTQPEIKLVINGMCVAGFPAVSNRELGEKVTVGLARRMFKFNVVVPEPLPLLAVMAYKVEGEGAAGIPEMAQVVLPRTRPAGKAGEAAQDVMLPDTRGACITETPTVSVHPPDANVTTGVGMECTPRLNVATPDPVLFDAVIV